MRHNLANTTSPYSDDYESRSKRETLCVLDVEEECEAEESFVNVSNDFAGALRLLVFSDKVIQPFEKKFIIDALSLGLETMSEAEKLALAQALSKTSKVSQELADRLLLMASEPVKRVLLETYAHHSEKALIGLARRASTDVLITLAERKGLTGDVVLELVKRQVIEVTRAVLENNSADRPKPVIEALIAQNLSDEIAALSLLNVPDMEPSLALKLFWCVGSNVRATILMRFLRSHALVENHFARIKTPNLRILPLFSAQHDLNEDAVRQGLQAAIDYFRQGQNENAFRLISLCVPLPLNLLEKIIQDVGGEAVVVLLKALGLKRGEAQKFLILLSQSPIARNWSKTGDLCEVYDVMSWSEARMGLSYWLWQDLSVGPYKPYEDARFLENILETDSSSTVMI